MAKAQIKFKLSSQTEYVINIPEDKLTIGLDELAQWLGYEASTLKNIPTTELPPHIEGSNKRNKRFYIATVVDWLNQKSIQ